MKLWVLKNKRYLLKKKICRKSLHQSNTKFNKMKISPPLLFFCFFFTVHCYLMFHLDCLVDMLNFSINIHNEGTVLEIVTNAGESSPYHIVSHFWPLCITISIIMTLAPVSS